MELCIRFVSKLIRLSVEITTFRDTDWGVKKYSWSSRIFFSGDLVIGSCCVGLFVEIRHVVSLPWIRGTYRVSVGKWKKRKKQKQETKTGKRRRYDVSSLDGNPGTRVTGHPSRVTLVPGHFFYILYIFFGEN
jgi:hypothetical protein